MDIITAEQAREITNSHVPYEIGSTMEYVMEKIKEEAKCGNNTVEFSSGTLTPYSIFETIKSDKFKTYIESFGYEYKFDSIMREYFYSEHVIISW